MSTNLSRVQAGASMLKLPFISPRCSRSTFGAKDLSVIRKDLQGNGCHQHDGLYYVPS